jgi:hypothetical protein
MIFFNDIINAGGTISIQENILSKRPAPSTAGRLFVQTNSPYGIFRDTGSSWVNVAGTGGGGGDWNTSLDSGTFTSNKSYDFNSYWLKFNQVSLIEYHFTTNNYIVTHLNYFTFFDTVADTNNVFYFEYSSNPIVNLGDFNIIYNGTKIILDDSTNLIVATIGNFTYSTYSTNNYGLVMSGYNISLGGYYGAGNGNSIRINDFNNYIDFILGPVIKDNPIARMSQDSVLLGDIDFFYNNFQFLVDRNESRLATYYQSNVVGLELIPDFGYFYLGDIGGYWSGSRIEWNLGDAEMYIRNTAIFEVSDSYRSTIRASSQIEILSDNQIDITTQTLNLTYLGGNLSLNGTGITQNTSGSTSSAHLKVKINGTNYVIQLRNP